MEFQLKLNEYSGLILFRNDRFDLFIVQRTLKSLLKHHSSKTSILQCSAFFMVHLPHLYLTTGKAIVAVVQSLSHVRLFASSWTAACQASLSFAISCSLLKLMSIESGMQFNHLILCHSLLLLPSVFTRIRIFSNESALASVGQSIGASASASVLPMNI